MKSYFEIAGNIRPVNQDTISEAKNRLDGLAKPIGSLGKLEEIAAKVAGITEKVQNKISGKSMIIMAADNGVCEEGVSCCPQDVTIKQSLNFIKGITGIGVLAKNAGADIRVIDIGINSDITHERLVNRKIRKGTYNIAKGPAMTREEAVKCIEIGIEAIEDLVRDGYNLIGTGEMGIGNTSTSSAVLMALTKCCADTAVGKGAGLTDEGYINKKRIIEKSLHINKPDLKDPIDVVSKVGGFDIAGLIGCYLGAAYFRIPIVIDGFISAVAALAAYRLNPFTVDYMIPSHCSLEPGFKLIMQELKLEPYLNLDMRLGEGTGCPLAFNIIEAALSIINDMVTFEDAEIDSECYIDIRKD